MTLGAAPEVGSPFPKVSVCRRNDPALDRRVSMRARYLPIALAVSLVSMPAVAQTPAISSYNPIVTGAGGFFPTGWASGWFFQPTVSNLTVSQLGYFNPFGAIQSGETWTVSLYQANPGTVGTLLASAVVNMNSIAGGVDPVGGQFWYTNLSTWVGLSANVFYAILVDGPNGTPVRSVFSGTSPLGTLAAGLSYGGLAEKASGCGGLITVRSDPNNGCVFDNQGPWTGATFALGPVSTIPEPSTVSLMAIGLVGLGATAWRRRKTARSVT